MSRMPDRERAILIIRTRLGEAFDLERTARVRELLDNDRRLTLRNAEIIVDRGMKDEEATHRVLMGFLALDCPLDWTFQKQAT